MSEEQNQFGECPECGKNDGYRNVYKHHFFFCDEHRFVWLAGTNLFSSWQEETEEDWRASWEHLKGYRVTDGYGEYKGDAPLEEQRTLEELLPSESAEFEDFPH